MDNIRPTGLLWTLEALQDLGLRRLVDNRSSSGSPSAFKAPLLLAAVDISPLDLLWIIDVVQVVYIQ